MVESVSGCISDGCVCLCGCVCVCVTGYTCDGLLIVFVFASEPVSAWMREVAESTW
jgi:hypothetical protein